MLVENEKVGISSHQWPQEPILLPPFTTAPSSTAAPAAAMVHHQDHSSAPTTAAALKCPRCDSSNTKFCYYNNYSLSQPRHFCKACKRYWTRGGTLRNVPVGGGCRKNTKRRPQTKSSSSSVPAVSSSSPSPLNLPTSLPNIAPPAAYNMPTAADMSLAFPSLRPYGVQPQLDALSGLGFTSSQFGAEINLQLSDYQQFGSLLASSLRPPNKSDQHYQSSLLPYEDPQATGNLGLMKEVKVEGDYSSIMTTNINRVEEWQLPSNDNPYETLAAAADHSSSCLYWNVPGWPDAAAANCGSSIAPLI